MRLMQVFLFIITPLSLGACYPATTIAPQVNPPMESIQVATSIPTPTFIPTLPQTEEVLPPTLTRQPIMATQIVEEEQVSLMANTQPLTITVIYDNNLSDRRLKSSWGFSALVEYRESSLLFDTGGDGQILMENMRILGIDPTQIDNVVLSHAHGDHTGGLTALLEADAKPVVYLLPSFPVSFKRQIEQRTQINEVSPGQSFTEGLWTTGEMGSTTPEQALVIQTGQGLVVITGCAHPGIVAIVQRARDMFSEPVRLVLGGFHLGSKSAAEINAILKDFRRLGVEQVAPCHCTGERAIQMFAAEYGEDFLQVGAGSVIRLETVNVK
jgi:7,8-dihydropterin-6-yl-methyl-4-(beta-D-ribofuranosyl)aminobenzene 5'-phosphate synthase